MLFQLSYNKLFAWLKYIFILFIAITVLLNGYEWRLGTITITPERILALPILFLALFSTIIKNKMVFHVPITSKILIIWLSWTLLSCTLSPVPLWSLKMYLLLLIAVSFYYVILLIQADSIKIFSSKVILFLSWFFGPILSGLYLIHHFDIDLPNFIIYWFQEGSGGTRIRGPINEANLFGAFITLFILMIIARAQFQKIWWWFLLFGLHLSLIFSFSRMPWIAYIFGIAFYFILINPKPLNNIRLIKYFVYISFFTFILLILGYIVLNLYGEYEIIGRIHSITSRFVMWSHALKSYYNSPFLGNGIFSFSALYPELPALVGSESIRSAWISNLPFAILHDTGLIGFILFHTFLIILFIKTWKIVRVSAISNLVGTYHSRIGGALLATFLALFISSQTIPQHTLGLFWIILALMERYRIETLKIIKEGHSLTIIQQDTMEINQ